MSLINVSNLSFAYDGSYDYIFQNVSFQMDTDWKLGFTGRNGRGKTTFMNLLLGKYEYTGSISASVDFEYFPYEVADKTCSTMDVLLSVSPDAEYWQIARELNRLETEEDLLWRPYNTLSNGEQTKVLLAAMFLRENSFLLIDEPTNHLDMHGRELVSRYLNSKKGFILVSHDRVFLDGCIDHILSINRGNIEIQRGNFSSWWKNKERQDRFELSENEKLKKEISHLQTAAKEHNAWGNRAESDKKGGDPMDTDNKMGRGPNQGAKAAKQMRRVKALEARTQSAIEEKSSLLKNVEYQAELKLTQLEYHTKRLLELKDVSVSYGSTPVCSGVSFCVEAGDRIALCGKNGCGKSSLIRLICGEEITHTGQTDIGSRLKISLVSQDASGITGSLAEYARLFDIDESLFKAILIKLNFSRSQFDKDMKAFSAGQKKKVLIARSLCEKAHLHIWDEPMNYIDVISRMQIEDMILQFHPTLLFVEHDRAFTDRIATKKVLLGR